MIDDARRVVGAGDERDERVVHDQRARRRRDSSQDGRRRPRVVVAIDAGDAEADGRRHDAARAERLRPSTSRRTCSTPELARRPAGSRPARALRRRPRPDRRRGRTPFSSRRHRGQARASLSDSMLLSVGSMPFETARSGLRRCARLTAAALVALAAGPAVHAQTADEVRALWVVRTSLTSPAAIATMVDRGARRRVQHAARAGARTRRRVLHRRARAAPLGARRPAGLRSAGRRRSRARTRRACRSTRGST